VSSTPRHRWLGILLVLAGAGCSFHSAFARDFELYVVNTSDTSWLVRVEAGYQDVDAHFVHSVGPGADGVAVSWWGDGNKPIELLDINCNVLGVFETTDGERWLVRGIDGLEARIGPGGTWENKWNTPQIGPTDDCGGTVTL
jgi:hypothetical protein